MGDQAMGATRYVAFLRAVNVGGRIVKMAELKKIFEELGLADVSTFIASGNVVFTSSRAVAALSREIESGLQKTLGYTVTTMLRSTSAVVEVASYEAFSAKVLAGASLYVGFMRENPDPAGVKKALALQTALDSLQIRGTEVYWLARKSISESSISGAAIEKALQTPVTFRNINTVRRLAAKYPV